MLTKDYYNDFFEIGQQKINFSFFELRLPDDDPVYTLKKVMEELDFSGLLACYSDKGRTGYNPIMLYAVVTYANMRGVRAVDRIVDLCQRDLAFIWLTKGQNPQRDAFYDFKGKKLTGEVLDELNYQFMRRLEKEGLTLVEIAPGIDLERDILANMDYRPIISEELKEMPKELFYDGPMGLAGIWERMDLNP